MAISRSAETAGPGSSRSAASRTAFGTLDISTCASALITCPSSATSITNSPPVLVWRASSTRSRDTWDPDHTQPPHARDAASRLNQRFMAVLPGTVRSTPPRRSTAAGCRFTLAIRRRHHGRRPGRLDLGTARTADRAGRRDEITMGGDDVPRPGRFPGDVGEREHPERTAVAIDHRKAVDLLLAHHGLRRLDGVFRMAADDELRHRSRHRNGPEPLALRVGGHADVAIGDD